MAASLVDRATSSMLIGPDWAMNTGICDTLNRDPGQAKDVVKGIKRRLRSKKPKVQFLALTLLETMVKSCGEIVHMHIAERNVLHDMVKIVRKKVAVSDSRKPYFFEEYFLVSPGCLQVVVLQFYFHAQSDVHVKEKVLVLIDTWQEAFGGARARYPQYYAAYQELLLAGAVFPQRSDQHTLTFEPSNGVTSFSQSRQGGDYLQEAESSAASNLHVLTLAEVQSVRETMDVLSEMLNALNPSHREELKQEALIDLVEQCRANKQKVVHLVNTTSDEALLSQGLALNDDLQNVLAKHDAIAAGIPIREEKPKAPPALVDVGEDKAQDTASNVRSSTGTTGQSPLNQLLLTGPPSSNEKSASSASAKVEPLVDLLSWDDVTTSAPANENNLALVTVNEPTAAASTSEQNALVLYDMFAQGSNAPNTNPPPAQPFNTPSEHQMSLPTMFSNGNAPAAGVVSNEQPNYTQGSMPSSANPMWNTQPIPAANAHHQQQQQSIASGMNDPAGGAFPLPPWEAQPSQETHFGIQQPQFSQGIQSGGMYTEMMQNPQASQMMQNPHGYPQMPHNAQFPVLNPSPIQSTQISGMYPYPMQGMAAGMQFQQPVPNGQMGGMHFQQPMTGGGMHSLPQIQASQMGAYYAYSQQQQLQYLNQGGGYAFPVQNDISQQMYGLSMQERYGQRNTAPSFASSLSQPMNAPKQEDKFFGDLVNIAKSKNKSSLNQVGSL